MRCGTEGPKSRGGVQAGSRRGIERGPTMALGLSWPLGSVTAHWRSKGASRRNEIDLEACRCGIPSPWRGSSVCLEPKGKEIFSRVSVR